MYKLNLMSPADLDLVLIWRNDPRVRNNMYTNHIITEAEHRSWFGRASIDPSKRLLMCVDESDVPVGVIIFSDIDQVQKRATWAFYSGDSARRGVGSEMERLALDYAFDNLGLKKLNCEVLSFNMPVVAFHRKHGFQVEGIFRAHYSRDGVAHDVYRLALCREAWLEHVRPAVMRTQERSASAFKPGDLHREQEVLTREYLVQLANLTCDRNSARMRDSAAHEAGFEGAQVQCMLVTAGLSRILGTVFPGPGTICVSQSLEFRRPVHPETKVEYSLRIISIVGRRATLSTSICNSDGVEAVTGEAEVLLPKSEVS
jgi:UDP-4-amino-4,6-dideoxy-N-acetyl-beta-L-altrosamine N-acetyltransferase